MSDEPVSFRLLGGIEADRGGHPVDIGGARQRCVLAVLLVEANTAVRADDLIDRVWADETPLRVRESLYSYLTRLRRALPEVTITRRGSGYTLAVDEAAVDLHRFRMLVNAAASGDDHTSDGLLDEALALWRGEPFAGVDLAWFNALRANLDTERIAAELDHADIALRLGRHNEILPRLAALADERVLDERLAGQLMLALYRGGRQADALRHYERTRTQLADELGIDPGPALRELHQRILVADPAIAVASPPVQAGSAVPRQLPAAPRSFTGRDDGLARISAALDSATETASAVIISAIGGTGGIGKTWLALHWAHGNLDRFPDGQLFVNLRGFDPSGTPTSAPDALRGFLGALGVEPSAIPPALDTQTALYRSLVAGRRMLIVLDNAAESAQVVPLLPGSPSCTVVVTSRDRMLALVNAHGAQPLPLDVLSDDDARALLANRLGEERLAREPEAVADLRTSCAGLPLALSIVVGRALEHPDFPLRDLANELRDAESRLNTLDVGTGASVRSVLSWSYAALPEPQARVFGLLGLAPGPDISLAAVANLIGLDISEARTELRKLESISLIQQQVPGRYRMHDLVRLYAKEQASGHQTAAARHAALYQLIDFYARTTYEANQQLNPHGDTISFDPRRNGYQPEAVSSEHDALVWLENEHTCLMAAQSVAAKYQWPFLTWVFAHQLTIYHRGQRLLIDELTSCEAGLAAAYELGQHISQAHRLLGRAYQMLTNDDKALEHLRKALTLAMKSGDLLSEGHTHRTIASQYERQGDNKTALKHSKRALLAYRTLGMQVWEAQALNSVGWYSAMLGEYAIAHDSCTKALEISRDVCDPTGVGNTLDSLGYIAFHSNEPADAIRYYREAIDTYRKLGDAGEEANTLERVGDAFDMLHEPEPSRESWQAALHLYQTRIRE